MSLPNSYQKILQPAVEFINDVCYQYDKFVSYIDTKVINAGKSIFPTIFSFAEASLNAVKEDIVNNEHDKEQDPPKFFN